MFLPSTGGTLAMPEPGPVISMRSAGKAMRKRVTFLCAAAALGMSGASLAGDMSYSYVQADLVGAQLDGSYSSITGSGAGFRGALELGPYLYLFADHTSTGYSGDGVKFRFIPDAVGLGAHVSISSALDIFGGASLEHLKTKAGQVGFGGYDISESDKGWGAVIGLRGWLGERFQWTSDVTYRDIKDLQKLASVTVGGYFFMTPTLALGMDFRYDKYDNFVLAAHESVGTLSLRYSFGHHF
jgi:hypothetical protein